MGPRTVLDAVVKRKIPSPRRESNPRTPIVQVLFISKALISLIICNHATEGHTIQNLLFKIKMEFQEDHGQTIL
jgi:hypothetical protein